MQGEPLETSDDISLVVSMIVNMLCPRLPEKYWLLRAMVALVNEYLSKLH
jgi:hypothetical protein